MTDEDDAIEGATTDGKCDGCGRRLVLDEMRTARSGHLTYHLVGSALVHDPVECVLAHAEQAGASSYRTDGRIGQVPKVLPPKRERAARRAAERALGWGRQPVEAKPEPRVGGWV